MDDSAVHNAGEPCKRLLKIRFHADHHEKNIHNHNDISNTLTNPHKNKPISFQQWLLNLMWEATAPGYSTSRTQSFHHWITNLIISGIGPTLNAQPIFIACLGVHEPTENVYKKRFDQY